MSPPNIIASCKQTRFHLQDDKPSHEIDVEGLDILVKSAPETDSLSKMKPKGSAKAKAKGKELITDAHLRLKAGVHYGLIGRNGTGKSTLLKAMAEKLIPGIPHATRIAILQQSDHQFDQDASSNIDVESENLGRPGDKTVLEHVMSGDRSRNDILHRVNFLSKSFEADEPLAPVRAIRKIRHDQLKNQLFLSQKNASLKSGSRGFQARKDLKSVEAKVQASLGQLEMPKEDIDAETVKLDTQEAIETLQDLQSQVESMKLVDVKQQACQILIGLGFRETDFSKPFSTLSGGWRMRCTLASVLIQNPDVMILDEPTNFLDLLGVVWLEKYLQKLRELSETTIVLVSHDRDFVNAVCEEIIILRDQKLSYFRGNLSAFEKDFEAQKLYWGRMKEAQEQKVAHMEATVRDAMKIGKKTNDDNKLRMAKSRQRKIDERMGVQVSASGGKFKLNRDLAGWHSNKRAEIEVPTDEKGTVLIIPDATELRFPGPLASLESVSFRYKADATCTLNDINLVIHMGDRVGIMGLNGSGKTTLIRLLAGDMLPSKGTATTHPRLKVGYYSQHMVDELQEQGRAKPEVTALALMTNETEGSFSEGDLRGLLSALGLQGRTASDVPISKLSGGQLVRLALARIVWSSPQLLILDEISTHLDFHTVTALASALSSFNGAILLVSHDRFLIRSVVEGKRDIDHKMDDYFEGIDEESEETQNRRRAVFVMKAGRLHEQQNGVEQFEESLVKRIQKMPSPFDKM
ncbi:P-loop containing nucleoside triphosphate hydrolase protein [Aspergillus taichungensis]|uniref:P-loop containing nucleoside triphosphate hydrolase protein n=1 Tax=Aspergillus taichungensis TaxID=482145 RepID=A0A2J5HVW8_9EURO|nr:P-loop containing nucleoside triphosphate hydrolase protein [Aspergillus taichungensis]